MMNTIQKRILIAGAVLFVVAALYVPWKRTLQYNHQISITPIGYAFLTNPPQQGGTAVSVEVNWVQVLMAMFVIAVVAGVAIYLTKDFATQKPNHSDAIQDLSGRDLSIRK